METIEKMDETKGKDPAAWARGIADVETFGKECCIEKVESAYKNLKLELDMQKAVADVDLVIESMAENVEAKIDFYKKLAPLLHEKTILVTNSSTLLLSQFAEYTGREVSCTALCKSNLVWKYDKSYGTQPHCTRIF